MKASKISWLLVAGSARGADGSMQVGSNGRLVDVRQGKPAAKVGSRPQWLGLVGVRVANQGIGIRWLACARLAQISEAGLLCPAPALWPTFQHGGFVSGATRMQRGSAKPSASHANPCQPLKWISIGMQTDKNIDHQPRQLTTRIELYLGYDGYLSPVS